MLKKVSILSLKQKVLLGVVAVLIVPGAAAGVYAMNNSTSQPADNETAKTRVIDEPQVAEKNEVKEAAPAPTTAQAPQQAQQPKPQQAKPQPSAASDPKPEKTEKEKWLDKVCSGTQTVIDRIKARDEGIPESGILSTLESQYPSYATFHRTCVESGRTFNL